MQDLLEALASYTQRHFVRVDRLVRSSFLLDYTLASMNVVMPEEAGLSADGLEPLADSESAVYVNGAPGHGLHSQAIRADSEIQAVLANHSSPGQLEEEDEQLSDADQDGAEQNHAQTAGLDAIQQKQAATAQTEGDRVSLSKHKSGKETRGRFESTVGSGKLKRKKSKVAG